MAVGLSCESEPPPGEPEGRIEPEGRHVQLIHLDGFRSDVFRALFESGRLPHFEFLLSRGRIAYDTATVDKSETMKVIQSYLTSQVDTEVVGWWQFNRSEFRFRNYWLDPAEVLNYALGLEFPNYPTILDLLASRDENLVAGMSLARRGVPFENYGRTYLEGAKAVYDHTYYRQAHATMERFLAIHERIARSRTEKTPALSVLLLAAADELSHWRGVTLATPASSSPSSHCFRRDDAHVDPTVFEVLDENAEHLESLERRYFTEVEHDAASQAHLRLCVDLPVLTGEDGMARTVHPDYALAMIFIDMEIGRLIDRFRSIRFDAEGRRTYRRPGDTLLSFMTHGEVDDADDSLFQRTLFIVFGDHGMVDTKHWMAPAVVDAEAGAPRDPASLDTSFLDYLNQTLHLQSGVDESRLTTGIELGIDFESMPPRLSRPEGDLSWQSTELREVTEEARTWSREFFEELRVALRANLHERYWWLFFLRSLLIDPRLDETLDPVAGRAVDLLAHLYLRGDRAYLDAETAANRDFFDRHVRLVYGGGARNNAELFFPSCLDAAAPSGCSWASRPSYRVILDYRGGTASEKTVIETLQANPGVGLIFVREENDQIRAGSPVPATLHIRVLDRSSNTGVITVWRDEGSGQLVFRYRVDDDSVEDPLGYDPWGRGEGTVGTYREWNDRSAAPGSGHLLHNAVAGVGSYLYSDNPAIGDLLIFHRRDWNFGNNAAGHGGIHAGEKQTILLVSGRGVGTGALVAPHRYRTLGDGIVVASEGGFHSPTLLDIAPTALVWLGLPEDSLEAFGGDGFREYWRDWNRSQQNDILAQLGGAESVGRALEEAGFSDLRIEQFRGRLGRLLDFMALSGRDAALFSGQVDAARYRTLGLPLLPTPQHDERR